jgi:hypothetical protein
MPALIRSLTEDAARAYYNTVVSLVEYSFGLGMDEVLGIDVGV